MKQSNFGFKFPFEMVTRSVEETERFAEEFSKIAEPGDFFALFGEMGAGKTAFVRGFAKGFEVFENVFSPTFTIINEYYGRAPLVHCDMYRISSEDDLISTGFFDYLNGGNVLVVEWSENILSFLPSNFVKIEIRSISETERLIKICREESEN